MNRPAYNNFLAIALTAIFCTVNVTAASPDHEISASIPVQVNAGEVITVNTLDDVSDFSGLQKVGDLPGADGFVSFREAVTAANNTSGAQTIAFAIPPETFWLDPKVGLLRLEQGPFLLEDSGTTVDFSTQSANMGNTNPNGPEIGIYGLQPNGYGAAAIYLNGNSCVIKGLGKVYQRGYAVRIVGDRNRVIGCDIEGPLHAAVSISGYNGGAIPTENVIGGTASSEANRLVGLQIDGPADGNIVIGNSLLVGVDVRGATQFGVFARNNRIGGPGRAERNVISGAGYYGEEGFPVGAQITVIDADGTLVEGNFIGTTADGMHSYNQIGPYGVEVRDSRGTTIRGNLIAGLKVAGRNHAAGMTFGQAIYLNATNVDIDNTVIEGNSIGLGVDRSTAIPTYGGISVAPTRSLYHVTDTRIDSNHIAKVDTTGIFVTSLERGVTITGNSIHDCGALGIDLSANAGADGVTSNDAGDGDDGGNNLQNFPVIQSAVASASSITIQGTLDSSRSATFRIEFFTSPSCDPSGFGEGEKFIGSTTVSTDASGHAAFSVTLPVSVAAGAKTTATATRTSSGDTSEFSACVAVTQVDPPVAKASATPANGNAPLAVQFSSTGSSDSSGAIASYLWTFGDGGSSTNANPSHTYAPGVYVAKLTVTNSYGLSASDRITVTANTALRTTAIELSAAVQGADVHVTGQVIVRDGANTVATGAVVWATWTKPSGAPVLLQATTDANGVATFATSGGPGTYTLTITNTTAAGTVFDATNSMLVKSISTAAGRRRAVR